MFVKYIQGERHMKKKMLKAVTLTATAAMLMGTLSFTATGVLAGEKYPAKKKKQLSIY